MKIIILQIDSFILYYVPNGPYMPHEAPNIYWCDHINTKGSGPFRTGFDAGKDYEKTIGERIRLSKLTPSACKKDLNNLIQVNFQTRKRIITS